MVQTLADRFVARRFQSRTVVLEPELQFLSRRLKRVATKVHHLHGKLGALRYEDRAALLPCLDRHERVTGTVNDKLRVVGSKTFTLGAGDLLGRVAQGPLSGGHMTWLGIGAGLALAWWIYRAVRWPPNVDQVSVAWLEDNARRASTVGWEDAPRWLLPKERAERQKAERVKRIAAIRAGQFSGNRHVG